MMKQCPNGHEVSDEAKFCPICGAEIIDKGIVYCAKCGNEQKETEKFCPQCGTPFGVSPISDNNKKAKKLSKRWIAIASIACLLVLSIGGAVWYFLQKDKYSLEGLALAAVNYDRIGEFHEGLAIVHKGEYYGYIDKMGNEVIPCIYGYNSFFDRNFHDGLALVEQGGRSFFIDKKGKEAFPFNYESGDEFHEGLAAVSKGSKVGFIDTKGNEVIALTNKCYGEYFSEGLAVVREDMDFHSKYGYIDKKGNLVIPIQFERNVLDDDVSFNDGLAVVVKDGKYGYINAKGNEVIACKYDSAKPFTEGLAIVIKDDKYGFIDTKGDEVIPCKYSWANHFSEGYAFVKKNSEEGGDWTCIDKNGKEIFSCSYDCQSGYFHDGFAEVSKKTDNGRLRGFVDVRGEEVIPCIYDATCAFSEGLAAVQKDGVWGFVDKKGNSTFDIQNEDAKKLVQAQIKEEQRMEEERRRIEEENKPMNKFYSLAQSGRYVWSYDFRKWIPGCDNAPCSNMFFIYPDTRESGRLSYYEFSDNIKDGTIGYCKGVANYTITENILYATMSVAKGCEDRRGRPKYLEVGQSIRLKIVRNGDEISLVEDDGIRNFTYSQKYKTRNEIE